MNLDKELSRIGQIITASNIEDSFAIHFQNVQVLLRKIQKGLEKDKADFKKDSTNWGHVGSIYDTRMKLENLVKSNNW